MFWFRVLREVAGGDAAEVGNDTMRWSSSSTSPRKVLRALSAASKEFTYTGLRCEEWTDVRGTACLRRPMQKYQEA